MDEKQAVLSAWNEWAARHERAVLATVVDVKGSSYRRPGAKMLIRENGERVGSLSGGCLEADVCQKAWWWTENGPFVQTYDTLTDEEAAQEFGLGCNGIVRVLLQRIGGPDKKADDLRRFFAAAQFGGPCGAVATIISATPSSPRLFAGQRVLFANGKFLIGSRNGNAPAALRSALLPALCEAITSCKSRTVSLVLPDGAVADVFVEFAAPPPPLVVFGGGHDVLPLVRLAKTLGWHVSVVESRPAFARQDRFPDADRVIFHPSEKGLPFPIDTNAAVLVMNHRYGEDCALLRQLLQLAAPPRYLGVLGPRTRMEKMLHEIGWPEAAPWPPHLHAPVGLDIGADAPETIALSILAEIQACFGQRNGGKLRERPGPINEREA